VAGAPLTELALVPRRRVDASPGRFRYLDQVRPVLREGQVGGEPSCYQVGRLSWDFVPRRTDSPVRAIVGAQLIRPSDQRPYRRFASGEAPCLQDAAVYSRSPTTCAVGCAIPSLSRARRTFVRRGVLRACGSFRLPSSEPLRALFNFLPDAVHWLLSPVLPKLPLK